MKGCDFQELTTEIKKSKVCPFVQLHIVATEILSEFAVISLDYIYGMHSMFWCFCDNYRLLNAHTSSLNRLTTSYDVDNFQWLKFICMAVLYGWREVKA